MFCGQAVPSLEKVLSHYDKICLPGSQSTDPGSELVLILVPVDVGQCQLLGPFWVLVRTVEYIGNKLF